MPVKVITCDVSVFPGLLQRRAFITSNHRCFSLIYLRLKKYSPHLIQELFHKSRIYISCEEIWISQYIEVQGNGRLNPFDNHRIKGSSHARDRQFACPAVNND